MKLLNIRLFSLIILTLISILFISIVSNAQSLSLPKIFSDHMVLQRDKPISFWGKGIPGDVVNVQIEDEVVREKIKEDGSWLLVFPALQAGGPFEVSIRDKSSSIVFMDVYAGDVWIASGQSNMEWKLSNVNDAVAEIENADFPLIRMFYVENRISDVPLDDLDTGTWNICTPDVARDFSAVAYFFGRSLHQDKSIAVGLIDATWGGTPAEAWISKEMLHTMGDFNDRIKEIEEDKEFLKTVKDNEELNRRRSNAVNESFRGLKIGVADLDYSDESWESIEIPNQGNSIPQITWFRKFFEMPSFKKQSSFQLSLGRVSDNPVIYLNGKEVGRGQGSKFVSLEIPGKFLRKGKNVLTVRVANGWSNRVTFIGPDSEMLIRNTDNTVHIPLNGEWKYNNKLEEIFPEKVIRYSHYPGVLYNGMINPILPYTLTGAIWYQGESNAGRAYQYQTLFPKMIEDWRVRWGNGYFPFLFVQLANFESRQAEPGESDWAELREAQLMTLDYPNTGMAVIIDIGEADDIHPRNKQDVGRRLYMAAKKIAYGEDILYSGPIYSQMKVEGSKIQLEFDQIGSGLVLKNSESMSGFAVAGRDKKFYWADAKVIDDKVVLSSEKVKEPVAVRYAWDKNPVCTLFNKEDLPASPFRTDSWKGITEKKE